MGLKSKIEAIIYAAEEPVTVDQVLEVLLEGAPNELSAALEAHLASSGEAAAADDKALRNQRRARIRAAVEELIADYDTAHRGMEVRAIAGGYRMATRPEHHDVVRVFARSLKPPVRLSLPALETLAVIAYKQPITVPEIGEIRGVDCSGVIGTLLDRKLITTAGRKAVIGRPILYKTTKEFLMRFGLKDVSELPSMEEFEKLAIESEQSALFAAPAAEQPATEQPADSSSNGETAPSEETAVEPQS